MNNLSNLIDKSSNSYQIFNQITFPDQLNSQNIKGNVRFNTSSNILEVYNGSTWGPISGSDLWEINSGTYIQPLSSITSGVKIDNITSQSTNKIKLNNTIELKSSDYPSVNIYVDSNYLGTVENGTQLNPYKTIQAGINALPINQTGTATYTRYIINVAGGNYDEDINIPANRFCNIIQMVAKGSVYLGLPSGSGQYFNTAVTNRNFTIYYDTSAWISTNYVRPTLSLLCDKTEDTMSTHNFYAGSGWRISGDILIDTGAPTAYRSCDFHFENVFVSRNVTLLGAGILTGGINTYMYGCKINGLYNIPFTGNPSATNYNIFKCEKCSFTGLLTVKTLAKAIDSYFAGGINISINTDAIEPYNIMYGCKISGTFSSVSTSTYYCDLTTKNKSTSATLTNVILNSDVMADNIYESTSGNGIIINNDLKVDNIYEKTPTNGTTINNYLYLNNLSAINNNDSMSYYTMGTGNHKFYINNSANIPSANFYNQSLAANNENYITFGKTDALAGFIGYNLDSTSPYCEMGLYGLYSAFRCNDLNIIEIAPGSPVGAVLYVECPMYIDTINEYTSGNGINLNNTTHITSGVSGANIVDIYNSSLSTGQTVYLSFGKRDVESLVFSYTKDSSPAINKGGIGVNGDQIEFYTNDNVYFPYGLRTTGPIYPYTWINEVIGNSSYDTIVMGINTTTNKPIIGANNGALSAWSTLYINTDSSGGGDTIIGYSTTNTSINGSLKTDNIYELTSSNGIIFNNKIKADDIYEKTSSNGINLNNITHIKSTSTNTDLLDIYNSSIAAGETIGISLGKSATSNDSVYLNFKQHATTSIGSLGLYGFDMIQFDNDKNLNFPYGFRTSGPYKNGSTWISSVIGPDLTNNVVVIGNYTAGNNAIIGAHNTSLSAWAPLYINSYNTTSGSDIVMGSTSSVTYFNSLILLPNYSNYSATSYEGSITYDSTSHEIKFYNGTAWKSITGYTLASEASKDINIQRLFTDEIYPKNPLSKNVKISSAKIENLTIGDSKNEKHALGVDEIGFFYNADNTKYYLAANKCNNKYKMHNETYEYLQTRFKKLIEKTEKLEKLIEKKNDDELNENLENSLMGSTLNLVK